MSVGTATGLAITNPLVKYRALVATKAISPDPVSLALSSIAPKMCIDLVSSLNIAWHFTWQSCTND